MHKTNTKPNSLKTLSLIIVTHPHPQSVQEQPITDKKMPLSTIEEAQARQVNTMRKTCRRKFLARVLNGLLIVAIVFLIILLLASFIGCIVSIMDQGHYRWMGILLIVHVCVVVSYGTLSYFSQDMVGLPPRYVCSPFSTCQAEGMISDS